MIDIGAWDARLREEMHPDTQKWLEEQKRFHQNRAMVTSEPNMLLAFDLGKEHLGYCVLRFSPGGLWSVPRSGCWSLSELKVKPKTTEDQIKWQLDNIRDLIRTEIRNGILGVVAEGYWVFDGNILETQTMERIQLGLDKIVDELQLPLLFIHAQRVKRVLTGSRTATKREIAVILDVLTGLSRERNHHISDACAVGYVGFHSSGAYYDKSLLPVHRSLWISGRTPFSFEAKKLRRIADPLPNNHEQLVFDWLSPATERRMKDAYDAAEQHVQDSENELKRIASAARV